MIYSISEIQQKYANTLMSKQTSKSLEAFKNKVSELVRLKQEQVDVNPVGFRIPIKTGTDYNLATTEITALSDKIADKLSINQTRSNNGEYLIVRIYDINTVHTFKEAEDEIQKIKEGYIKLLTENTLFGDKTTLIELLNSLDFQLSYSSNLAYFEDGLQYFNLKVTKNIKSVTTASEFDRTPKIVDLKEAKENYHQETEKIYPLTEQAVVQSLEIHKI